MIAIPCTVESDGVSYSSKMTPRSLSAATSASILSTIQLAWYGSRVLCPGWERVEIGCSHHSDRTDRQAFRSLESTPTFQCRSAWLVPDQLPEALYGWDDLSTLSFLLLECHDRIYISTFLSRPYYMIVSKTLRIIDFKNPILSCLIEIFCNTARSYGFLPGSSSR